MSDSCNKVLLTRRWYVHLFSSKLPKKKERKRNSSPFYLRLWTFRCSKSTLRTEIATLIYVYSLTLSVICSSGQWMAKLNLTRRVGECVSLLYFKLFLTDRKRLFHESIQFACSFAKFIDAIEVAMLYIWCDPPSPKFWWFKFCQPFSFL